MSVFEYVKERRYLFLTLIMSVSFGLAVFFVIDKNVNSPILYVLEGGVIFFTAYLVTDYFVLNARFKKMKLFIDNGAFEDVEFNYPLDILYAKEFSQTAKDYNVFRSEIATLRSEEIDFITKWVHDVKVPISAIYLLLENVDDEIAEQLEMQTSYIEQHTQKILYHIKSNSFYDDYKIEPVKIKEVINSALKQFAVFFAFKKIALTLELDDFTVLTDGKWSGYIISQLLSNAIKYTKDYGEIKIKAYKKGNRCFVSVKNTGDGIAQKDLKRIFKKGYSSLKKRYDSVSTGYGLYLSKKLADIMGHELYANSQPSKYAEFNLVFAKQDKDYGIT